MKKVLLAVLLSLFVCGVVNAADVGGFWKGYYDPDDIETDKMTLKQNGKIITGSMEEEYESTGNVYYSISGKIVKYKIKSLKFIPMVPSLETKEYKGTLDINESVMELTNVDDPSDTIRFIKEYSCDAENSED